MLELLQWKGDIHEEAELLAPLCTVLRQLLSFAAQPGSASIPKHSAQSAMDTSDDEAASDEELDIVAEPAGR